MSLVMEVLQHTGACPLASFLGIRKCQIVVTCSTIKLLMTDKETGVTVAEDMCDVKDQ